MPRTLRSREPHLEAGLPYAGPVAKLDPRCGASLSHEAGHAVVAWESSVWTAPDQGHPGAGVRRLDRLRASTPKVERANSFASRRRLPALAASPFARVIC